MFHRTRVFASSFLSPLTRANPERKSLAPLIRPANCLILSAAAAALFQIKHCASARGFVQSSVVVVVVVRSNSAHLHMSWDFINCAREREDYEGTKGIYTRQTTSTDVSMFMYAFSLALSLRARVAFQRFALCSFAYRYIYIYSSSAFWSFFRWRRREGD